jgi:hypothetical protein
LNLIPSLEEYSISLKQFHPGNLALDQFSLQDSIVILNDEKYLGKLGVAGGKLAWFEVPGLGKVEFSLIQFREAKAIGSLDNGQIKIQLNATTGIDIYNVRNGATPNTLEGGPYQIWVRWTPSTKTIQQWADEFEALIKSKNIPQDLLDTQRKRIRSGQIMEFGVGGIMRKDELPASTNSN